MKLSNAFVPALILFIWSSSGCMQLKESCDQCLVDCRNRCMAEKAWMDCKSCYNEVDCPKDFGRGFKDGYIAVANGGGTCQPALPPEHYWQFCYQNPCGQDQMLAWFNGYTYGAIYAEQEGIGGWSRVMTAPTLPPYRKRHPAKAPAAGKEFFPSGEPAATPYVEPVPPDEAPPAPSAAKEPKVEDIQSSGRAAAGTAAGTWTGAADSF